MNTMTGRLITLEGTEGVGKSSAVDCVAVTLRSMGYRVVATREPGGTPIAEKIREILLTPTTDGFSPIAELLLMFAARAQHLDELIRPALANGEWVVCDRFTDASYAYQGGGRGLDSKYLEAAEALVHPDLQPSLTLLLDAPADVALGRAKKRSADQPDRFEAEAVEFFESVRASYLARAARYSERFVTIDASQSMAVVHEQIASCLRNREWR